MKKILTLAMVAFMAIAVPTVFTACDDDNDDIETVVPPDQIPDIAKSFLAKYYPTAKIQKVVTEQTPQGYEYDVILDNKHEITFDTYGYWIEIEAPGFETIPAGILPAVTEEYLSTNYPYVGVHSVELINGQYKVELLDGKDLIFDKDGNFVAITD